jgi:hypothetical protein
MVLPSMQADPKSITFTPAAVFTLQKSSRNHQATGLMDAST